MSNATVEHPRKSRGTYYTPPTVIRDVPGVVTRQGKYWSDFYSGTAEALIAAGLLTAELFPGQPGRNSVTQTYRPIGGERQRRGQDRNDLEGWHILPGYMQITRQLGGRFQICLTVSREEQARRQAIRHEASARRESLEPPRASVTPEERLASVRTLLGVIVDGVGVEEVQRMLDTFKPRQPRPRASYLQLVVSRPH